MRTWAKADPLLSPVVLHQYVAEGDASQERACGTGGGDVVRRRVSAALQPGCYFHSAACCVRRHLQRSAREHAGQPNRPASRHRPSPARPLSKTPRQYLPLLKVCTNR